MLACLTMLEGRSDYLEDREVPKIPLREIISLIVKERFSYSLIFGIEFISKNQTIRSLKIYYKYFNSDKDIKYKLKGSFIRKDLVTSKLLSNRSP